MDLTVSDISRLKTGTPEEKRQLLEALLRTRAPASLDLAVEALGDDDWTVRRYAAGRLGELGAVALDRLGKALSTGNENQRYWAMRALVEVGRDAVPLLLKILEKGPKAMRLHAATALGEIGDPTAIPALTRALGDEVWQVRFNAYEGLVGFGEKALSALEAALSGENEDRAFWSAKALGKLGESSREVLLTALRQGNRRLRFVVAAALGETGDLRVVKVLLSNLRDKSWIVRKRSADALAEIGEAAIPLVVEDLAGDIGEHSRWLLQALCDMGDRGQLALAKFLAQRGEGTAWDLKDPLTEVGAGARAVYLKLVGLDDQDMRFFAATCLGELESGPKVDDALLRCLQDPCWSIRKVAADALARRGPAIMPRLEQAMDVGNEDQRYWVSVVYRKMGAAGVERLIEALGDSNTNVAYFAASALAEVPEERVLKPLIRALGAPSWPVRNAASTSLSLLCDISVKPLVQAIEDESEDVAFWVRKTLKRIGRRGLVDILRLLKKGGDEQRLFAAKALGVLRDPAATEALIEALKDGHEWVRLYACVALGEIADPRAVTHLLGSLADPTFRVHPRMIGVFEKFGDRVLPELVAMADGEAPGARANALMVLGALKVEEAFKRAWDAALDLEAPSEVRLAAIQALGRYDDRPAEAVRALGEVLGLEGSGVFRSRAILALGEIEDDASVPVLLKASATAEAREDTTRVGNILQGRGNKILPVLVECLGHKDVGIRKAAAETLEEFGGAALPYVRTAAQENDQNIRFWGQKLVKKLTAKSVT